MGDTITQSLESLATDNEEFKKALKVLLKYEIHCLLQRLSATGEEAIVITTSITDGVQDHLGTSKGVGFLQEAQTVFQLKQQFHQYCTGVQYNVTESVKLETKIEDNGPTHKRARLGRERKSHGSDQLLDGELQLPTDTERLTPQTESRAGNDADGNRERQDFKNGMADDQGIKEDGDNAMVKGAAMSCTFSICGSDQSGSETNIHTKSCDSAESGDLCEEKVIKKGPGHATSNDSKQNDNDDNIPVDFTWKVERFKAFLDPKHKLCKPEDTMKGDCRKSLENFRPFESSKSSAFHAYLPNDTEVSHSSRMSFDSGKQSEVYDLRKNQGFSTEGHRTFSEENLMDFSTKSKDSSSVSLSEILTMEGMEQCSTRSRSDSHHREQSVASSSGASDKMPDRDWHQGHAKSTEAESVLCQMDFQLRMQRHIENELLGCSVSENDQNENADDLVQRLNLAKSKEADAENNATEYSNYKGKSSHVQEDQIMEQSKQKTALSIDNHKPVNLTTDPCEKKGDRLDSSARHTTTSVDEDKLDSVPYMDFGLDYGPVNLKTDIKQEPAFDESLVSMEYSPSKARSPAQGSSPVHLNFTCKICGQNFKNRQYRDFHVKLHTASHKFLCNLCSLGFDTEEECTNHQSAHTEPVFQCDNCGYRCTREFRMRAHKEICGSPAKIFTCPFCDKQFAAQRYMRIHMKSHDSQNVHSCPYCQNTYPLKNSLLKHMKKKHSV